MPLTAADMTPTWNTTFKKPAGFAPLQRRSPEPPRAHVEPLSPPRPIEPNFNYPALTNVGFSARSDQAAAAAATPKPRPQSANHRNGHHRTPSTIDTLAEAALAVSPTYPSHSRKSLDTYQYQNGYAHGQQSHHAYGTSEPPHKRSRSELLPSPQVGLYASRPATSYESHQAGYDSRVEEAALLLNFRTGGWPSNGNAMSPPQAPPATHRPHANSFPQDAHYTRPADPTQHHSLLPPFNPQHTQQTRPNLPSPQRTSDGTGPSPEHKGRQSQSDDLSMKDALRMAAVQGKEVVQSAPAPQQTHTPPDDTDSRAESVGVASSEASETVNGRRGWPKGKPRGVGKRKTIAEKAVTKRAASRKKATGTGKAAKRAAGEAIEDAATSTEAARRKSFSDIAASNDMDSSIAGNRSKSVPPETLMFIREASPSKAGRRKGKVSSDTVCAGCSTSRENATANSEMDEWISCNGCKKWFHIDCAGFKKAHEIRDVDKYFCAECEPQHGKTTYVRKSARAHASVDYAELQKGVLKTSEESMEHHYIKPIKDGTFQFDPESFPRMRPEMVTRDFFEKSSTFTEPICIPAAWNPRPWNERAGKSTDYDEAAAAGLEPETAMADLLPNDFEYDTVPDDGQDKLDMVMPQGLTVRRVCELIGSDMPLDVIDVKTQNSGAKWTLGKWADYYEEEGDEKAIRNVISLEVSQTKLGRLLRRPKVVRDIDLQDSVWPQEEREKGKWPKVQYYCLMSVADSYTDFHIDFGGSSVYYHILKGKKTFFFIPPKPKHLKAYEDWNESPQQNYTFLPSITKECYRVDLHEGDTALIPSGWIHAVWTPETSLVIGGNFLTRMSYKNQFKVVDIEKANHTPMKFRYPFFQRIMWYTVLQYLARDALPPEISQSFLDGTKFERELPIWQDFDGDIAANDSRPGAQNARYYSKAELDGLGELRDYIWKTVMIVQGRIEGYSEDQKKRINASIPKGFGEPLEIARTFALWVAWKLGNADVPGWAHPDFALESFKEEGPPKKLSARALKDLERKEAIAAWRIAPDRISERVMSKQAAAAVAGLDGATDSSPAPPPSERQHSSEGHQEQPVSYQYTPTTAPPGAFMMTSMNGQYFSTPKTSVLGPKRVACDACRKRRIRCKHKDHVLPAPADSIDGIPGLPNTGSFQSQLAPELHDNITVTPPSQRRDGAQMVGFYTNGTPNINGNGHVNGHGPQPGTNAYVNANIPMTMNGVPIFGEVPKRGRSKACFECRKSKRRCVHDDSGNVDPVKAAETPVPRGSATKKRSMGDEGSPSQIKKPKQQSPDHPVGPAHGGTAGVLVPPKTQSHPPPVRPPSTQQPPQIVHHPPEDEPQPQQPEIDPNLFSYPEPTENGAFANNYPYPTPHQAQATQAEAQNYEFQSLEQIANEVLDMNGRANEDFIDAQLNALPYQRHNPHENVHVYHTNGATTKTDESVDSAVSFSNGVTHDREKSVDDRLREALSTAGNSLFTGAHTVQPPVETNGHVNGVANGQSVSQAHEAAATSPKINVSALPLYQPPAPLSQSPEQTKRQPLTNGSADSGKRKGEPLPVAPGTKKTKVDDQIEQGARELSPQETVDERLAKELQQEELGLRRRSSRS